MKKWIIILIVVILAGTAVVLIRGRIRQQQINKVLSSLQTVKTERGDLVAMVGGTGVVRTNQTAILPWETSGNVEEVLVKIGDKVNPDEVLASLKQISLPQNIILAEADLANAQKALEELYETDLALAQADQAIVIAEDTLKKAQDRVNSLDQPAKQSDIDAAEATMLLAKIQRDKAWDQYKPWENKPEDNPIRAGLYNKYTQAQQQYDNAAARLNNLRGTSSDLTIRLAQAELDLASASLEDAQKRYDELVDGPDGRDITAIKARIAAAQAALNQTKLTSPFAGTITEVKVKPGDRITPGAVAFRLDDTSRLLVDVPISEVDISRVRLGQDANLTFDAIPGIEYQGKVVEVAQVGNANQGVVDFNVTVELVDADEQVKPGMTAAINLIVEKLEDVLLIPNRAVRLDSGERVIYVLKNGIPEAIKIVLGSSSEAFSQLLEGDIQEGDEIVLNPPEKFEFGQEPSFVRNMRGGMP